MEIRIRRFLNKDFVALPGGTNNSLHIQVRYEVRVREKECAACAASFWPSPQEGRRGPRLLCFFMLLSTFFRQTASETISFPEKCSM